MDTLKLEEAVKNELLTGVMDRQTQDWWSRFSPHETQTSPTALIRPAAEIRSLSPNKKEILTLF